MLVHKIIKIFKTIFPFKNLDTFRPYPHSLILRKLYPPVIEHAGDVVDGSFPWLDGAVFDFADALFGQARSRCQSLLADAKKRARRPNLPASNQNKPLKMLKIRKP